MIKRRRRFKQTVSFKDRLAAFANDIRQQAARSREGRLAHQSKQGRYRLALGRVGPFSRVAPDVITRSFRP